MPYNNQFNKFIREMFMHLVDFNLVYTEIEYRNFTTKYKKFKKIYYLNNTIQLPINIPTKFSFHHKIPINILNNKNKLVYCGRLTTKPKLEFVLKFLYEFDLNDDYYFIIIGDGEERYNLQKLVLEYGLEKKVNFLGSIYDEKILSQILHNSDLFVYPGSIGLSLFTAFANSLPVITHDEYKYQAPEFYAIENNYNAILFKYLDINDFDLKIKSFFENKDNILKMKNHAFDTISKKYTLDKMTNNFIQAINF
jgi:glycosyltransferase involved in cell wall biosynthesis